MKKESNFLHRFIEPGFLSRLLPLALPIALQNLLTSTFAAIDTLMVGQLGDTAIAAVGAAAQIANVINIIMFGVASGGSVFVSQYWGARDHRRIHHAHGLMLTGIIPAVILFTLAVFSFPTQLMGLFSKDPEMIQLGADYLRFACFSYIGVAFNQVWSTVLRCTEETRIPMFSNISAVFVNLVFNYIFIFGKFGAPAMGVAGAALATVISSIVPPTVMMLWSARKRNLLASGFTELFTYDLKFVKQFVLRALPVLLNEGVWVIGYTIYNMVFGRLGTDNYAALTICRTVENIAYSFFIGVCNATNVIIGKSVGAGELEEAKAHAKSCMFLFTGASLIVGLAMLVLRDPILSLFSISDVVRSTTRTLLLIYCIELVLRNTPYILIVGVFRGGGDTRVGMKLDLLVMYLATIPAVLLSAFVFNLPFVAVYIIMLLFDDVIKSFFGFRHFLSMRWIQPVVDHH